MSSVCTSCASGTYSLAAGTSRSDHDAQVEDFQAMRVGAGI